MKARRAPATGESRSCANSSIAPRAAQVAGRTNDAAGDGTTTATVLAREMIRYGLQNVTAGANPISIKRGIDKTCDYLVRVEAEQCTRRMLLARLLPKGGPRGQPPPDSAAACALQVDKLKEKARPVRGSNEIKSVAAISAGNDDEIGQMIADALDKARSWRLQHACLLCPCCCAGEVRHGCRRCPNSPPTRVQVGADGVLAIETSNSLETTVDVQEGMEIDRGYISPQFVNNK